MSLLRLSCVCPTGTSPLPRGYTRRLRGPARQIFFHSNGLQRSNGRASKLLAVALLLLPAALLLPPVTWAASVSVRVVDDQGSPLGDMQVELFVVGDDGQPTRDYRRMHFARTDPAGMAQFPEVGPGRWGLTASSLKVDRRFLDPNKNPHTPPPRFTIKAETGPIDIEIVVDRGVDVCTRYDVTGFTDERRAQAFLTESETSKKIRRVLESNADFCRPLFSGRWEFVLQPPRGLLLVGLDINGQESPGAVGTLDLRPGDPTQFVTWRFVAPAKLEGYVRFDGEEGGVSIRADLIEPGPWAEAVKARGGSMATPVYDGPDPTGYYSMLLADGLWRIQPEAAELEKAEPESVELRFAPGDEKTQDFLVRVGSGQLERDYRSRLLGPVRPL